MLIHYIIHFTFDIDFLKNLINLILFYVFNLTVLYIYFIYTCLLAYLYITFHFFYYVIIQIVCINIDI